MRCFPRTPALLAALLSVGCGEDPSSSSSPAPTVIVVDPLDFLGQTTCSSAPGGVRRYVATVIDITVPGTDQASSDEDGFSEFALPSSGPVACTEAAGFINVLSGHWYVADVQGYDRTDIEPRGPGSFLMVDSASGEAVAPRWSTSCGRASPDGPILALYQNSRKVRECAPFQDLNPNGVTGISVDLRSHLGGFVCGDGAGEIATYRATLGGGATLEAACAEPLSFDGLDAASVFELEVQAFEAGAASARFGTTCFAKTVAHVIVPASCDPLHELGGSAGSGGDGSGGAAGAPGAGGAAGEATF